MKTPAGSIQDEEDYDAAIAEADRWMDAESGSEEGARLDALVTAIEAYEAERWPIDAPGS